MMVRLTMTTLRPEAQDDRFTFQLVLAQRVILCFRPRSLDFAQSDHRPCPKRRMER